ncbi:capZ-interacting protein isoform X2 [Podarcis raffonei]|uniref:capZ-interacting protein isoform X2 n=1 Tax=Podarcis raffonei TaxID=65483 RepID=UPI00232918A1|nr:capZ-interacting protein isoform X2 [Podarcis raffonei]
MGEPVLPKNIPHLHNREDKPSGTNMVEEKSTTPSVAKLAGKFQDQSSLSGKEIPVTKPARRKPPCSLPLHTNKAELGQNGELKPSPNASQPLKVKANLAFAPAALLPGASPKSPGLKVMVSPFNSPPSTPVSPKSQSSEADETPVSFDKPPEGTHLQFYNKVRTRGSIKRRPPSRRFRKSQSEYGDDLDIGVTVSSQENGAEEENGVFMDKKKATKSLSPPVDGLDHHEKQKEIGSDENPPPGLVSRRTESKETEAGAGAEETVLCKDSKEEKPHQNVSEGNSCENIKDDKEKNPDHDNAEDTKIKSQKSSLRDREDGIASDQEIKDKGERVAQLRESEDTQLISDKQDTATPELAGDTETCTSSRV